MKNVNRLKNTLVDLFWSGETDEHDLDDLGGLLTGMDYSLLLLALRDKAETVYEYRIDTRRGILENYRGKKLFNAPATLLYRDSIGNAFDIAYYNRAYELWLLSDMSVAVVSCFQLSIGEGAGDVITTYRTHVKGSWKKAGMRIDFLDLSLDLDEMCERYSKRNTVLYPR